MNRWILYYWLLTKRFFKKKTFLVILCAIPLLTYGLQLVSKQDSGILRIALYTENMEGTEANSVIQRLIQEDSVLHFFITENENEAIEAVAANKADAAWIFSENYSLYLDAFIEQGYLDKAAVMIYEREDTVALELSRLKLYGAMFPELVYSTYCQFTKEEIPGNGDVSDLILREAYESAKVEENLFCLEYRNNEKQASTRNYLMAPVRGMLSLMIFLCGFASIMYYFRDEEQGMFLGIPAVSSEKLVGVYALAAMMPAAVITLVTLGILGQLKELTWELLVMFLFVLINCIACMLLKRLLPSARIMGACIPFFMLAMFAICPIFVSVRAFQKVQYLLPPYYYLNTVQNRNGIVGMMIYLAAGVFLDISVRKMRTVKP